MNTVQLPFLVEAILILAAGTFGFFLRRGGRPWGKVKLVAHLFFYLWLAVGYGYVVYGLTMTSVPAAVWFPALLMGTAVVAQVATGIVMLASKVVGRALLRTHVTSAVVMILSSLGGLVVGGFGPV